MVQVHSTTGTSNTVKMWHVLWVSKRTWKQISQVRTYKPVVIKI